MCIFVAMADKIGPRLFEKQKRGLHPSLFRKTAKGGNGAGVEVLGIFFSPPDEQTNHVLIRCPVLKNWQHLCQLEGLRYIVPADLLHTKNIVGQQFLFFRWRKTGNTNRIQQTFQGFLPLRWLQNGGPINTDIFVSQHRNLRHGGWITFKANWEFLFYANQKGRCRISPSLSSDDRLIAKRPRANSTHHSKKEKSYVTRNWDVVQVPKWSSCYNNYSGIQGAAGRSFQYSDRTTGMLRYADCGVLAKWENMSDDYRKFYTKSA